MKYAFALTLAALAAFATFADVPSSAEGWYEPEHFETEEIKATYSYKTDEGDDVSVPVSFNEDGEMTLDIGRATCTNPDYVPSESDIDAFSLAAISAFVRAKRNTERIKTIGKNLNDLTSKTGIHITNESTGQEFTIKFGGSIATAVSESSGDI